ncbi:MAG: hypothetical protein RQ731_09755 [Anaerosomatales bacterium]|nr:hypothetical protein [Anaerosomatales bacterium]
MNARIKRTTSAMRFAALLLTVALLVGAAPATASTTEIRSLEVSARFASSLEPDATPVTPEQKTGADVAVSESRAGYTTPLAKAKAPLPKPVAKPAPAPARRSAGSSTAKTSSTPASSSAPKPASNASAPAPKPAASSGNTLSQARSILASRIATYPILRGATVEVGDTKGNPQAICYYKSGRIIINPNHTVSVERIINHEIWHIIDWRDNGQINWGESVPPSNAADFRG